MKRNTKILCALLACAVLFNVFPTVAFATQPVEPTPLVTAIDWTRAYRGARNESYLAQMVLDLGGQQRIFSGELSTKAELTEDEKYDLTVEAARKMGGTRSDVYEKLGQLNAINERMKPNVDEFLKNMAEFAGVDTIWKFFDPGTSSEQMVKELLSKQASDQFLEKVMGVTKFTGNALNVFVSGMKKTAEAYAKRGEIYKYIEEHAELTNWVSGFYQNLSNLTEEKLNEKSEWRLLIRGSEEQEIIYEFTDGNKAILRVELDMTMKGSQYPRGNYEGGFLLEYDYDLSGFDAKWADAIINDKRAEATISVEQQEKIESMVPGLDISGINDYAQGIMDQYNVDGILGQVDGILGGLSGDPNVAAGMQIQEMQDPSGKYSIDKEIDTPTVHYFSLSNGYMLLPLSGGGTTMEVILPTDGLEAYQDVRINKQATGIYSASSTVAGATVTVDASRTLSYRLNENGTVISEGYETKQQGGSAMGYTGMPTGYKNVLYHSSEGLNATEWQQAARGVGAIIRIDFSQKGVTPPEAATTKN